MKSFIKRLAALAATAAMTASLVSVMPASAATSSTDDATAFLESMGAGWVLGNTLDATGNGNSLTSEISWSNPYTTKEMILAIHDAGFETIRIPVSWGNHTTGDDYTIDEEWMARVKEIVDWAYEDGMHVILNMHHDNSTTYYYPDSEHKESSIKFLTSVWSQIAEEFKDYDEKLVFETLNEPRLVGTDDEWWIDASNPTVAAKEAAEIINDFNQEIVTTIRSTGSNNANRYLICPGYAASMNGATAYFEMPEDTADNKIIVSVHSYTPYNLCLGSSTDTTSASATQFTESGKSEVKAIFDTLKENFTDKGIPCIIGEMGISNKDNNAARTAWASYYYTLSNEYNIPCMLWDNNAKNGSDKSENHWHFNRKTCKWGDPDVINAIMDAMGVTTRSIPADDDVVTKSEQTISGTSSYTKTYGDDDFTLDAKNDKSDGGTLAYESSDTSVVSVSTSGKVSIEGAGTATITVTALENSTYNEATKTVSITVNAKEITPKIDSIDDQEYTGEAITPKVKVKNGATYLTSSNYDVEYSNNTEVGTATVKVTLKGNYSGSATTTFEIVGDGTSSNTSSTVSTSSTASADSENSSSASGSTTSDTTSGTSNTATSSSSSASTGSSANTSSSDTNPSTGLEATGISLAVIALGLLAVSKKRK